MSVGRRSVGTSIIAGCCLGVYAQQAGSTIAHSKVVDGGALAEFPDGSR